MRSSEWIFEPLKILAPKNYWPPNKFTLTKFRPRKCYNPKKCWPLKVLTLDICLTPDKFWFPRNFLAPKTFDPQQISNPKFCLELTLTNFVDPKYLFDPWKQNFFDIFLPPKILTPKQFVILKNVDPQNVDSPKFCDHPKIFNPKNVGPPKKCWPLKNFNPKIFLN